jgi:hypothetical protein
MAGILHTRLPAHTLPAGGPQPEHLAATPGYHPGAITSEHEICQLVTAFLFTNFFQGNSIQLYISAVVIIILCAITNPR